MLTGKELARVEPRAFMRRMLHDFDRFFEEGGLLFNRPGRVFGDFCVGAVAGGVVEKNQCLVARLDLPGVKKEEISVAVTEDGLTIEGERKFEEEETKKDWYRTERTYGGFVRVVPLPEGVKTADIKATFEAGVLEIVVPLPAAAAAPRRIEIAGGDDRKTAKSAA